MYDSNWSVGSLVELALRALVDYKVKGSKSQSVQCLPEYLQDKVRERLLKRRAVTGIELKQLIHPRTKEIDLQEQVLTNDLISALAEIKSLRKINMNRTRSQPPPRLANHIIDPSSVGSNSEPENPPPLANQTDQSGNDVEVISANDDQPRGGDRLTDDVSPEVLIKLFSGQQYLQTLFLRGVENITEEVFECIGQCCPHLVHLDVARCQDVRDIHLHLISDCGLLESLSIAETGVTDQALLYISRSACKNRLKELKIDRCKQITDDGIQILLGGLTNLQILIFHGCPQVTSRARDDLEEYLAANHRHLRQLTWTVY
eukprot:TRINITY_DN25577_c0_g1_i1.p1 TRINITY_DN25577_c0_g1~~TRINITY_DN25577_c0_g1_i1.p1  ORF type:complete len:317 (-),score=21.24 TRINITY_DN25577_c0_g1_i1:170-1120(-)